MALTQEEGVHTVSEPSEPTVVVDTAKDEAKPPKKRRKRIHEASAWAGFVNKALQQLRQNVDPVTSTGEFPLAAEIGNVIAKKRVQQVIRYLYDLKLVRKGERNPDSGLFEYWVDISELRVTTNMIEQVREARKVSRPSPTPPVFATEPQAAVSSLPAGELHDNDAGTPQELVNQAFDVMLAPYLARIDELETQLENSHAELERLYAQVKAVRAAVCDRSFADLPEGEIDA